MSDDEKKQAYYIANAQGYCLEFRLSENTVNSYDAYTEERDKAEYVNNGWVPFQDWVIAEGTFYTADSTNFNNQRAAASDKNGWGWGDEGFGYTTRRKLYGPGGSLGLWDALIGAQRDTTGVTSSGRIIVGTSTSGNVAVDFDAGALLDSSPWSQISAAYIFLVRPL